MTKTQKIRLIESIIILLVAVAIITGVAFAWFYNSKNNQSGESTVNVQAAKDIAPAFYASADNITYAQVSPDAVVNFVGESNFVPGQTVYVCVAISNLAEDATTVKLLAQSVTVESLNRADTVNQEEALTAYGAAISLWSSQITVATSVFVGGLPDAFTAADLSVSNLPSVADRHKHDFIGEAVSTSEYSMYKDSQGLPDLFIDSRFTAFVFVAYTFDSAFNGKNDAGYSLGSLSVKASIISVE